MTTYHVGDAIEFELAPDGFCSRWSYNGRNDRGSTDQWRAARVTEVISRSFGNVEVVAETDAGDRYHFELTVYAGAYGYPSRGLRLVTTRKLSGKVRLVERTDPGSKSRYYATEVERSDAPAARELLTVAETVARRLPSKVEDYRWPGSEVGRPVEFSAKDRGSASMQLTRERLASVAPSEKFEYWLSRVPSTAGKSEGCGHHVSFSGCYYYRNSEVDPVTKAQVNDVVFLEDDSTIRAAPSDRSVVAGVLVSVEETSGLATVWLTHESGRRFG